MSQQQDTTSNNPAQKPTMLCGRRITTDLAYIPKIEYQGSMIYFCTESCLNAFLADPKRFYCSHGSTTEK